MATKVVFFGGIGTLLETSELQRKAFNDAFVANGLDWHWGREEYRNMLANPGGTQRILDYAKTFSDAGVDETLASRLHSDKTAHFHAAIKGGDLQAREGVNELIEKCLTAGTALGFATTTDELTARGVLDAIGIDVKTFQIITHRDLVEAVKPHPAAYLYCLARLGISSDEAIAIEDSESGLEAATRAGVPCLVTPGVNTLDQDYEGALAVSANLAKAQTSLSLLSELDLADTNAAVSTR